MTATRYTTNLAARMGRWSASHRKTAIFGWLAFVISAVVIGSGMGQRTIEQNNRNVGQAGRADQVLKKAGFAESGALTEIVVLQDKNATIADARFRSAVDAVDRQPRPPTAPPTTTCARRFRRP